MRVYATGRVCEDGGTLFVACEGPPDARVEWTLTGHGALTPTTSRTDAAGVASAYYDPAGGTPATQGETVTVGATCWP